jgi:hypothetical protein
MIKVNHSILNKSKSATIILLSLFFVMVGSCSIQKLITGDSYAQLEISKQSKTVLNSNNHQTVCLLTDEVVKGSLLSVETFSVKNYLNPLLLITAILGENIFLFKGESGIFQKQSNNPLASSFPLFLKYRVLII